MQNIEYSAIFKAIPLPCLILKPEGEFFTIVDANEKSLQLVQAQASDLIGKKIRDAFPDNPEQERKGWGLLSESLRKVVRTGERDSVDFLRYDISVRDAGEYLKRYWSSENIPIFGPTGEVEFVLHVVNDVTAQVLAQEKEQKMELQQRHFVDNNPDGLYSLDAEGNFTSGNEGIARIVGVPLGKLLNKNFLPFCHPEDQEEILQYFDRVIAGETIKFEAKFVSAEERNMILEISLLPMIVNDRIEGAYGIAKDFTSIRESEQIIVEKRNFLNSNTNFISSLFHNGLEDSALEEAFATVGKAVGVDRMYYFRAGTEGGETYLNQQVEWSTAAGSSQRNNTELQHMKAKEVEQMLGFSDGRTIYTAFPHQLPESEVKGYFLRQGIKSLLVLPIYLNDTLSGLLGFDDCTRERHWSDDEIAFLKSIAHNLTTALEKRAAEAALKEGEEALLKSERKFKAMVQEGSDLIAVLGEGGQYKFVSEPAKAILGFRPEEFQHKTLYDFIHPDDRAKITSRLQELEERKQVKFEPVRFCDSKGEWRWIETIATNLKEDPAVEGIVVHSRDITTLVEQAAEIKTINERYRMAATATQDLMYDWDLKTDKVERFHKTASFLGYPVAETNSRAFWRKHVHPDELEDLKQHLEKTLNDPDRTFVNSEYRFKRANGSYAHFLDRAYIIRDKNGKAIRLVGATSDVSDLIAKKRDLKIANKRFKMAMKSTREMIWDWNLSANYIKRSKAFKKIYGYAEFKNYPRHEYWMSKVHEEDRDMVLTSLTTALENPDKKKWRAEYRFLKANGEYAHVSDRGYILRDKNGKAVRMVGAVLDVTASRRALEKIEAQNRRLKEISWEQSHVVRAPLVRILGLLQLIEADNFEAMSYKETWGHIEASAREIDEIIRGIVRKTEELEAAEG